MWVLEAMRVNDGANLHQVDEVKLGGLVGGRSGISPMNSGLVRKNVFFYHCWEVFFFQGVDSGGEAVGSIIFKYWAGGLEEVGAVVVLGVYEVDGYAAVCFTGVQDCLVHVGAVHSFATEFWKQCGVDVYDPFWVGIYQG